MLVETVKGGCQKRSRKTFSFSVTVLQAAADSPEGRVQPINVLPLVSRKQHQGGFVTLWPITEVPICTGITNDAG